MSFTAQVKDELSRIEASEEAQIAELAAMVRISGTLSMSGMRQFRLSMSTETGAVARTFIRLVHRCFHLQTELTIRRSVLHKTRNYLIVIPEQPRLADALVSLGVLTGEGGLVSGIDGSLVTDDEQVRAYLRGSFMSGGFVSDPHAQAHFEIVASDSVVAEGLVELMGRLGITSRLGRRRSSHIAYLKSADEIAAFLGQIGAPTSTLAIESARVVKSMINDTNRLVNAEIANQKKTSRAASSQVELISALVRKNGLDSLPPALRDLCELRLSHPDLSLRELGEMADPPLSKSAVYHRVRRLEQLARESCISEAQSD